MSGGRGFIERRPGTLLYLLAITAIAFAFHHVAVSYQNAGRLLLTDVIEGGILLLAACSLVYGGWKLTRLNPPLRETLHVMTVTVLFGLFGFSVAILSLLARVLEGRPTQEMRFILLFSGILSAAVGAPASFYFRRQRQQQERLQIMNKRLSITTRVLRHNLRNKLSILLGETRRTSKMVDDPEARDALDRIETHLEVIEDLSENARRLKEVWNEDRTPTTDLVATAESAVERIEAEHPDVAIDSNLPDSAWVTAHATIEDAIYEALENAVVHNQTGEVEIRLSITPGPNTDTHTRVRVTDTGSGIPDIEIEALEKEEESKLLHASGLGLWLIYWVVKKSDGELEFDTLDSGGTVVTMEFPTAEPP